MVGTLVVLVLFMAWTRPPSSGVRYAPDNADPDGARAVAEVLGAQGVDVTHVRSVADAVRAAGPGTTLLVTPHPGYFEPEQIDSLAATEADVVLLAPDFELVEAMTDGAVTTSGWGEAGVLQPGCDDPAAEAAGSIDLDPGLAGTGPDAVLCWLDDEGDAAFARVRADDRSVAVIDDPAVILNESVLDQGNATLALWTLGEHDHLVWFVPEMFDTSTGTVQEDRGQLTPTLPPGSAPVGLLLVVVALFLAFWRGRRLGPLVTEDLPVLVRSAETTRGRGRLYRAARARGHAAAGLRASAADRVAKRLGLARSADAPTVVDAVVAATNRPTEQVAHLLYGPPPADDAALLQLARHLDTLESEVHRP